MAGTDPDPLADQFESALAACRDLYLSSGRLLADEHPHLIKNKSRAELVEWMDDLHKGLVVKIYLDVALVDQRWSTPERQLAQALFQHVWNRSLEGDALREATRGVSDRASHLRLAALIRPFARIAPLRQRAGELETVILRLANIVAKADGGLSPTEAKLLKGLQNQLDQQLSQLPIDTPGKHEASHAQSRRAVQTLPRDAQQIRQRCQLEPPNQLPEAAAPLTEEMRKQRLDQALSDLDALIGLDGIKAEIRSLANFLKIQQHRQQAGLASTRLNLHMTFTGNPGTGKTSVARIVAQIFAAMGILQRGHLVETDRSGLVAEYAGQTGPKTNKRIDEALGGVLFIDEAYSLVAEHGEDAYGREALQALLKRMEDDRDRLVVILAGYPQLMQRLLRCNPGLSSRFSRILHFDDYPPVDLARIFARLCASNQYTIPPGVRRKVLWGFSWLYHHRDEHFGNGRMVRNTFETAIRRLANRIADMAPVTHQLLTELDPDDISLDSVPAPVWQQLEQEVQYQLDCPGCQTRVRFPDSFLGQPVRCNHCQHRFTAAWGEPIAPWHGAGSGEQGAASSTLQAPRSPL